MHPTVKPVALVMDAILDCSSPHDIVLDPFCGSGTTLVAAQRTRRIGYTIEIDPLYCDVIVRRMQNRFKLEATLEGGGRSFDETAAEQTPLGPGGCGMSDDAKPSYEVGYGRPPKEHQFPPGKKPTGSGRKRQRRPQLVPDEPRRILLGIADEMIDLKTASGVRSMRMIDAFYRSLFMDAIKGNATARRMLIQLLEPALASRVEKHKDVWLTETLQNIVESLDDPPDDLMKQTIDAHHTVSKKKY